MGENGRVGEEEQVDEKMKYTSMAIIARSSTHSNLSNPLNANFITS
jgi:hypothetical protein